jgi:hypothetical protein
MKEIYVNNIYKQDNILNGVAVRDKTVWKNLKNIYSDTVYKILETKINHRPEPFYSFDNYFQFVIFIQFEPELGLSMKFIDFDNNTDNALDEYNNLKANGWTKEQIEKIMKLFLEIKESNKEKAVLIIEDDVSLPEF